MTAIQRFCDVIRTEMNLDADQVWIYNQKVDIPPDDRLYVVVSILNCKPFSNINKMIPTDSGLEEKQMTNFYANLSVDILSRSTEARDRKEEIILALHSVYAQQMQEAHGFSIARLSNAFANISDVEGSAIPYRFNITVGIQYLVTKQKEVDYYDTFENSVITEP